MWLRGRVGVRVGCCFRECPRVGSWLLLVFGGWMDGWIDD